MIFLDANVPMYLVGTDHPHKLDAERLVGRLTREQRRLVTSSEVFQEMLHRYISIERRDKVGFAFEVLEGLVEDVISIDKSDVFAARDLTYSHPRLSARDALHVAVMRRNEIAEIASFDQSFDEVTWVRRLPQAG